MTNKKGEIECHLDGSFIENTKAGDYAVYLGHNTGTETQQGGYARNAYSSLEPELRAIKTAIRVLPLGTNILCTTDSDSSIKRLRNENIHRKEKVPRYAALVDSIKKLAQEKLACGKEVRLEFVYSHLIGAHKPDMPAEEKKILELKQKKMKDKFGEECDEIMIGNDVADSIAKVYAKESRHLAYEHTEHDPDFILQINEKDVVRNPRRQCYNLLLEDVLAQHRVAHHKYSDWQGAPGLDSEKSALIMVEKSRKYQKLVSFAFKCRHDKLMTREHGYNRTIKDTRDNEWAEKKKKIFSKQHMSIRMR